MSDPPNIPETEHTGRTYTVLTVLLVAIFVPTVAYLALQTTQFSDFLGAKVPTISLSKLKQAAPSLDSTQLSALLDRVARGDSAAFSALGQLYARGSGVIERDPVLAYAYLFLASAHGQPQAKLELRRLYWSMTFDQMYDAQKQFLILNRSLGQGTY